MTATALIGLTVCERPVRAAHKVAMETVAAGLLTCECRVKKDMVGQHEWAFAGPDAWLIDRSGKQLAVSPGGAGNIPLPLVQVNPAMAMGAKMTVNDQAHRIFWSAA